YGQIEDCSFPVAMPVSQRITLHVARETHISLDKAQPNDPGVARVRIRNRCASCGNQRYTENGCKKTTKAGHNSPPLAGHVPLSRTLRDLLRLPTPLEPGT